MSYMNALGVNRAYPAIVPLMVRYRQTRTQTRSRAPLPKPRKTNNAPLPFLFYTQTSSPVSVVQRVLGALTPQRPGLY